MTSPAFRKALTATGYLLPDGSAAPGLTLASEDMPPSRLSPALFSERVGLKADAVFLAQNTPAAIFKDAGSRLPAEEQLVNWHEAAWNLGLAPLLWIVTPTEIRLYNCYASSSSEEAQKPLDIFSLEAEERLNALDASCGRLATETGAFWSSPIAQAIDRRHRVDRELLREINALEDLLTHSPSRNSSVEVVPELEIQAAREFAQRLIGRCIFTSYLIERGIAQPFLPDRFPTDVAEMFGSTDLAFTLFRWLRKTFNGDLFPMDDPGAEHQRLSDAHLDLIRDFIEGTSLVKGRFGQRRLFRFRYDAIPVDLISSIYQQFARSSAAQDAHAQGLHYTPIELVHLTLDPVFEGLSPAARVIDPTCGSGAFLVEAFRRLVWKNTQGKPARRTLVRKILYEQLFGIDINRSALGIAAFSLYLAALELDEEPVTEASDLTFHRLIDKTLFRANTVDDELPREIITKPFDAVIGNPPWTFVRHTRARPKRSATDERTARPRRSPDQAFLTVASQLAGEEGRIGMIMKASPFFSNDEHAIESRGIFLRKLAPIAIVNLSALRKEQLFPDATGPALLFFARCAFIRNQEMMLVGSVPWTPEFRRSGIFEIGPGELKGISMPDILRIPALLKASTFGTLRDGWLIQRLHASFPTLDELLTGLHISKDEARGQGFQVKGDPNQPPESYYNLHVLLPDSYEPLRIDPLLLPKFDYQTLHRPREASIYVGPVLICPKSSFLEKSLQPGRYSASISFSDLLFSESFYGISFANQDPRFAHVLSAILNSSLTSFQFAFGGGAWGLERPTVEPNDLLSLRVPDLTTLPQSSMEAITRAEQVLASYPQSVGALTALDNAVFELYELEPDEATLAAESVIRARMLIFEAARQRRRFVSSPAPEAFVQYATELISVVNAYLRARGQRHLEATIYPEGFMMADLARGIPGISAVKFAMRPGAPSGDPIIRQGNPEDVERFAALLRHQFKAEMPPYLNERRQLRIYTPTDLLVLKPAEVRYWTRTTGLNDADLILADHWTRSNHAFSA